MLRTLFICFITALVPKHLDGAVIGHTIEQPFFHRLLYEDDEFRFYARDYGTEKDPHEPALIVQDVESKNWAVLVRISTKDAKFGYLPEGKISQMPWDYRHLRKEQTVELPLGRRLGFLNFPRQFLNKEDFYLLVHNDDWNDDRITTVLKLDKKATRDIFIKEK